MRATATVALAAALLLLAPCAQAQYSPLSRWSGAATRIGRVAPTVGGGWPAAFAEVDFGINDILGLGLRAGYLYGSPHAGLRIVEGALIEVPARLRLLERGAVELSLEATAGLAIGTDRGIATLDEALAPELTPLAPGLAVALVGSWRIGAGFCLKFGVEVPVTVVLDMTEPPYQDVLELTASIDPILGFSWTATPWLSVFLVAQAGPALAWVPVSFTADGYEHEVRIEPHLRGTAGVAFTPWP